MEQKNLENWKKYLKGWEWERILVHREECYCEQSKQ